jgi:hypothetical protein
MDNRHEIKVGDYFNLTRLDTNESDTWNNQNRFETCQLKRVNENGAWEYVEYWDEYSSGDYPFLSSQITWDVFSKFPMEKTLIEKISDPETEGFKEKKILFAEKD